MKAAIHPKWQEAVVTCACGTTFSVGTTIPSITVEVCSACHPFYTGQMKFVDTKGRVDAFLSKQSNAKHDLVSKSQRRAAKHAAQVEADLARPDSLSELRQVLKKSNK